MPSLKEYRDELYSLGNDEAKRMRSIEMLLIRAVETLDLVIFKLDANEDTHTHEGRALHSIAKALNKIAKAHVEMTHVQKTMQQESRIGNDQETS